MSGHSWDALLLGVARGRHRLTDRGYRLTVRVAGVLLLVAGVAMAVRFALAA